MRPNSVEGLERNLSTDAMYTSFLTLDTAIQSGDEASTDRSMDDQPGITFRHHDDLPRLPIPDLKDTLDKFLQFLEALQTPEQKHDAQQAVLDFMKQDGPRLQKLLTQYEEDGIENGVLGSYLEEFWNDSFLVPDPSVVLNLNPFFILHDGPDPPRCRDPVRRASSLCFAAVKMASAIRDESLLPDNIKGRPLCMDQFKAVFGTARVPHSNSEDEIDVYPFSTHVIVVSKSQIYYFQALWSDGVVAVNEDDIFEILSAIDKDSRTCDLRVAARKFPGVLTLLDRSQWATVREEISELGENEQFLTIIDSGLFVLVLDDTIPQTSEEAALLILHGAHKAEPFEDPSFLGKQDRSCSSRWNDKLQIIVCGDGTAGLSFENSAIDGHTALRVVSDIYAETVVAFAQSVTRGLPFDGKLPNVISAHVDRAGFRTNDIGQGELDVAPKKITLEIPERIQRKIFHAEVTLGDQILSYDTRVLEFHEYGKSLIVANEISPDSFVQVAIMTAYFKVYGKLVCTYEPVLTKYYFHGRTEAMRSALVPVLRLCGIFFDPKTPATEKRKALLRAVRVHSKYVKDCARGHGVDRHLFALKAMSELHKMELPVLFKSDCWKMLNHTVLLTCNCGNPSLRLFGIAPVVPNGYGIGYITKDKSTHFSITSNRRQTDRFCRALNGVMRELPKLLQRRGLSGQQNGVRTTVCDAAPFEDMWETQVPAPVLPPSHHQPPPIPHRKQTIEDQKLEKRFLGGTGTDHTPIVANRKLPKSHESSTTSMTMESSTSSPSPRDFVVPLKSSGQSYRFNAVSSEIARNADLDYLCGHLPEVPRRRGSMFSGMSRRESLSASTLSQSGSTIESESMNNESDTMVGSFC